MLLSETSTESLLPLKLQEYLWEQTGSAFKSALEHGKYEFACTTLERMLIEGKTKELKLRFPEVYSAIKSISRWTFVKGALPYVIHCCSNILQQRTKRPKLRLTDKLSPSVTKLFATLHWVLLESADVCSEDKSSFSLPVIELFVQTIIPHMHNLYESDLILSLQSGLYLWPALWNHYCPRECYFAVPVVRSKQTEQKNESQQDNTVAVNEHSFIATYFDVAVLKVLSLDTWNQQGYRWGILYLQHYLQKLLYFNGFNSENCPILEFLLRVQPKKSTVSTVESSIDLFLASKNNQGGSSTPPPEIKFKNIIVNESVPESLKGLVNQNGELSWVYILGVVKILLKKTDLLSMTGNMIFLVTILSELFLLHQDKTHNSLVSHHGSMLNCYLAVFRMLGCEKGCQNSFRGLQDCNYRVLLQKYFNRVLLFDSNFSTFYFKKYIESEKPEELISFLHSLIGFCEIDYSVSDIPLTHNDRKDIAPDQYDLLSKPEYLEMKSSNEKMVFSWIGVQVCLKLTNDWSKVFLSSSFEYLSLVVKFTKFVRFKYPFIYRKILLTGLLASFDKSKLQPVMEVNPVSDIASEIASSPLQKGSILNKPDLSSMQHGKKFTMKGVIKLWHPKTIDESDISISSNFSSLPKISGNAEFNSPKMASFIPPLSISVKSEHSSLNKIHSDEQDNKLFQQQLPKGKLLNLNGLRKGLVSVRVLLELAEPGSAVDEVIIAAMLDLEAPVVSRACYLLELAYFVHCCNHDIWPLSMSKLTKGFPYGSTAEMLKHQAGLLFHKWAVAIGKKLEELIAQDQSEEFNLKNKDDIPLMYQGQISFVSSKCPQSLRFAACLLLQEITSYLRETFVMIPPNYDSHVQPAQSNAEEVLVPTVSGLQKKNSSALTLKKGIQRRKSSMTHLLSLNDVVVDKAPLSPSSNTKQRSSLSHLLGGSPKNARSFSRRTSSPSFDKQSFRPFTTINASEEIHFSWLNTVLKMNKTINFLCNHGVEGCHRDCLVQHAKLSTQLQDAFQSVYDGFNHAKNTRNSWTNYFKEKAQSLAAAPFQVLCKGILVMDNQQLQETITLAWEMLLYPDQHMKSAAASLFLVGANRLGSYVGSFLLEQFSVGEVEQRIKAILSFGVLWSNQYQVYDHLEDLAKFSQKIPLLKVEYTLPSRRIGEVPDIVPDAPWVPAASNSFYCDISDDEDFYTDSNKQGEAVQNKRAAKLKGLRERFPLSTVPFSFQSSLDYEMVQDEEENSQSMHYQIQPFFPESMSLSMHSLIRLLDDTSLSPSQNQSVSSLARQIVWRCLVDYPETFFRKIFEKITRLDKQDELVLLLRKLLFHFPLLPPNAAHLLLNNLIGVIIYHNRTNKKMVHERIFSVMSLLWEVVPSVPEVHFTTMKPILRREHVDHVIMMTANIVGVKEIVVAMPTKEKFNVFEDMTFQQLLNMCKDICHIDDSSDLWLVDKHSGFVMNNEDRVRDIYMYKRGHPCPTVKLEKVDKQLMYKKRQQQALTSKQLQIAQLLLAKSMFEALPNKDKKKSAVFLFNELCQQPTFPRKVIDIEFDLCSLHTEAGKAIFDVDIVFKDHWIKLISNLLGVLAVSKTYWEDPVYLFIDPVNGAFLLHAEDVLILRSALAAYINISLNYSKMFAVDGYLEILPTILKVYSYLSHNTLVKEAIEFAVSQMFITHQCPFILQLLASAAPIVIADDMLDDSLQQVPGSCLFSLIESLDRNVPDVLDIMALVQGSKPLKLSEYCIDDEANNSSSKIDLSLRLALTIIAYKAESSRAVQMMFVISVLLPCYLKHLELATLRCSVDIEHAKKNERRQIKSLITYVSTIIDQNTFLCNPYHAESSVSSNQSSEVGIAKSTNLIWNSLRSVMASFRQMFSRVDILDNEEHTIERVSMFGENPIEITSIQSEERRSLDMYYQPRTVLLTLASDFILNSTDHYVQLQQDTKQSIKSVIVEDQAMVLLDIANSMLNLILYDHDVLNNIGLIKFLLEAMPLINWSEYLIPFGSIVKKINQTFTRMLKRPDLLKFIQWDGLQSLIKGIYLTVKKQESLALVPEIKLLLLSCVRIIVGENQLVDSFNTKSPCFLMFSNLVIKLAARLLFISPIDFNLEQNFSAYVQTCDFKQLEQFLVCWLFPLCIRMGTRRCDYPQMALEDIHFVLSILMSVLTTPKSKIRSNQLFEPFTLLTIINLHEQDLNNSLLGVCFLGFKILSIIHPNSFILKEDRNSVRKAFQSYLNKYQDSLIMWNFVDFTITHKTALYIPLLPSVKKKLENIEPADESLQQIYKRIKASLHSPKTSPSHGETLKQLLKELASFSKEPCEVFQEFNPDDKKSKPNKFLKQEKLTDSSEYPSDIQNDHVKSQPAFKQVSKPTEEQNKTQKEVNFRVAPCLERSSSIHRPFANMSRRTKQKVFKRQNDSEKIDGLESDPPFSDDSDSSLSVPICSKSTNQHQIPHSDLDQLSNCDSVGSPILILKKEFNKERKLTNSRSRVLKRKNLPELTINLDLLQLKKTSDQNIQITKANEEFADNDKYSRYESQI